MSSLALTMVAHRRSLSDSCDLKALADTPEYLMPLEPDDPLTCLQQEEDVLRLMHRSKSESFICTSQGIVFPDTQLQKCQSRVDGLVEMATNASSSHRNVLLAKKALRYRKMLELRRIIE